MSKLVSLQTWAVQTYGQDAPCAATLRRWVKGKLIRPAPVKHGRAYFVAPEAVYTEPDSVEAFMEDVRASTKKAYGPAART